MSLFLTLCQQTIGAKHVLSKQDEMQTYVSDWRQREVGKALAILIPSNTEEVAALVKLCAEHQIGIVPQGGNTGLVLGSIPDQSGTCVVLSLRRLNRIRSVDTSNNTMTVEAGCLLAEVQGAAQQAGRLYPLSLASEGSCTIGGNLSTNAGGTAVLRYGNARELCLGLEVVTATGEIWNGLRGLRKDNTGYDLRDLYIGAEGTLGIITAAVIKLFPIPKSEVTALVALADVNAALKLLSHVQDHTGASLTGFELFSDFCLHLVYKHFAELPKIFESSYPQYVLLELASAETQEHTYSQLEFALEAALQSGLIIDVVIANSLSQSTSIWKMRELISSAQAREGKNIKHDISLPVSQIGEFISQTDALLQTAFPGCRMLSFGHLGDGNLHYNVSPPVDQLDSDFLLEQAAVNRIVHDSVHLHHGSISAEHGIGTLKKEELLVYKSPLEMRLMQSIKTALDPHQLMNPGKVI
ncbi:FAD-binding oxidoreductase [Undibacterium sp. Ren11W]|uniref:FAD-binding oxidoreductase n=1 Tax=Undibacterium sp. Ren11W TaxID=3413045 RepID=UPI003BEFB2CB